MISTAIQQLVNYGLDTGLILPDDEIYIRNQLLMTMQLDSFTEPEGDVCYTDLESILKTLVDDAVARGVCDDSPTARDLFDTKLMGDLLQRMNDHGRVQSFLTNQALGVMFTSISFVVFGAVLAFYDLTIFAVFIVGSLAYGLWLSHFLGHRKVLDYELFEQQAINQNKTYQFITAMQEIKLQQCERRRREEWEQSQRDLFHVQTKSLRLQQTQEAGSVLINELKNILITVLAATAVIHGNITLGMMLATQYIVGQLNSPVEQLMSFIFALQDVKISLERINEIHHKNEEDAGRERRAYFSNKKGLELKAIDFRYDLHSPRKTINGVSFSIPEGKVTAIVGASGSGKTTILKLLLGYYPVESGTIVLSGCDLSEYNLQWWRSQCGVVMQDGVIFSESIERNIAVDDSQVDHKRLEWAAHIACIHDHIMSLPLQYDTKIGRDGVGLSQGQRQRILIARAVYKNPDFIFLDEATNSLDANNERMIVENLDEFYKGKTVVIVAHRLSTVKSADQIVVLDNGKVVETGTHKTQLLHILQCFRCQSLPMYGVSPYQVCLRKSPSQPETGILSPANSLLN